MSSSSFVLSRFPVPASVFLEIDRALAHLNAKQRRLVLHVLVSNLFNLGKMDRHGLFGWIDASVELPCQWMEEHFGSRFRPSEIDASVLTFQNYSTVKHECRSFLASSKLLDLLLEWSPTSVNAASDEPIVNLFDGKPYQVQAPQEWEHGVYSSKIIRRAVAAIQSCPFDYAALNVHLRKLQAGIAKGAKDEDRERLQLAFRNDKACADRIRAGCQLMKDGSARYHAEYRTSYTGRITEVGGGAQSCSRAMKAALFDKVPGMKNYDLKRAQAFILLQELEDAGLPRDWVEGYVHAANANEERAQALGMSKDAYKSCLYATIMGAGHVKHWKRRENKIFDRLLDECNGDETRARELAVKVYGALAPLKVEVAAWHEHLLHGSCRHVDPIYKARTLKNACQQHFKLEGQRSDKLARRAAAFVLQGQEGAFIHHLTALGSEHGFVPVNNQHDGLVVIGEIPQVAVDQAASLAGLRYATMEQKPFI